MRKADVVSKYRTQQRLAEALSLAPSTVSEWPEVVPLQWAAILALSDRRLKVDLSLYDELPPCLVERRA